MEQQLRDTLKQLLDSITPNIRNDGLQVNLLQFDIDQMYDILNTSIR